MRRTARIGLHAVVVGLREGEPAIATVPSHDGPSLPFGPFDPERHPTLDQALRAFASEQTGLRLGFVEQLYTFGDAARRAPDGTPLVSIGYLALVGAPPPNAPDAGRWSRWYDHFPWEDRRGGVPAELVHDLLPALARWVARAPDERRHGAALRRQDRFAVAFGCGHDEPDAFATASADEEKVLERYELLYEAGLVPEAGRDRSDSDVSTAGGRPMPQDHRRILATAMARLRGKLKYRPVVFELLPEHFTLTELQTTVEALSGRRLHKQNFRRSVQQSQLVEATGATASGTGGRPAALFRFRRSVLTERPAAGFRIAPAGRS